MSPFLLRDEAYRQAIPEVEERGRLAPFLLLEESGA
jgi:hypothetical protein